MSNNLLLAAAVGAAVFLVVKKQGQAAIVKSGGGTVPRTSLVQQPSTGNINGDMWAKIMGTGFTSMLGSSSGLVKNIFGQTSTPDGKPIGGSDPTAGFMPVLVGDPSKGVDYLSGQLPLISGGVTSNGPLSGLMDWGSLSDNSLSYSDDLAGLF